MNSSLSPEKRSEILLQNIEHSDCGVIALQAVTGRSRKQMEALAKKHGYDPKGGTPHGALERALEEIGYKTEIVFQSIDFFDHPGDTPATFAATHEYGSFLIYVVTKKRNGEYGGHVMALVEGDLYNSVGNWRIPCREIVKVTR